MRHSAGRVKEGWGDVGGAGGTGPNPDVEPLTDVYRADADGLCTKACAAAWMEI